MSSIEAIRRHGTAAASGPSLLLATAQPARKEPTWDRSHEDLVELKLGFRELVLVHRSLEAVRTLGLIEGKDDVLTDTLQLIDVALEEAA
jgi:hypothetical protein